MTTNMTPKRKTGLLALIKRNQDPALNWSALSVVALIAATLLAFSIRTNSTPGLSSPPAPPAASVGSPVLQGDAATERLKEEGHYESLMQAMQAARYAVETIPDGPATGSDTGCFASNPAHALRCWFRADGLELKSARTESSPWKLNLRLRGYGREMVEATDVGTVSARQNRVELSHANGAVVEWYENKAAGLEQGFTVRSAPAGGGPLRLLLEAEGNLQPELEHGASTVKFVAVDGQVALRYSGLKVWDAKQRELAAHLEVRGRELALVVNDHDATYPVTIDPLITSPEAKLTAGDGAPLDEFGWSVSLSGDGNTALVGARYDDTSAGANAGSAYVFVRSGTNWNQQAKLTAGDGIASAQFGHSVSVSGDGNTALVGSGFDDSYKESAYVFVRSGSTWSQQAKLIPEGGGQGELSVSVSADGNTALLGSYGDKATAGGNREGSAYVFVRSGSTWSQQAKLTAGDGAYNDAFGWSVSLSGDGNTALVGAWHDDTPAGTDAGSAYVFVKSGTNWSQQAKLTAGDGAANAYFGHSVSVSGDGNTALVGADGAGAWNGSAYVFVRSGSTWSQQAELAAGTQGQLGFSVSVSGDGNTALVGAFGDNTPAGQHAGSAYVFVRSGSAWSQQAKLTASDGASDGYFGMCVSVSGDGNTALAGASWNTPAAGTRAGSAYVFRLVMVPPPTIVTPSPLPDGVPNLPYSLTLQLTNGLPPFGWMVVTGSLPAGVILAADTGILSGTPTTAGTYAFRVRVTDGFAQSLEQDFSLVIRTPDYGFSATQSMPPYVSPGTNIVSCQVIYPVGRQLYFLYWQPVLPPGWTLVSAQGDGNAEALNGEIVFGSEVLPNPLNFAYRVAVAAGQTNTNQMASLVMYLMNGMTDTTNIMAAPNPFLVGPARRHCGDYDSSPWTIGGVEVSWVLSYWRAQAHHLNANGRDGYAVGTGNTNGSRHDADWQAPFWTMDGTEANRVLAYWRAGAYHPNPAGEDGYAPGPMLGEDAPPSFAPALKSVAKAASGSTTITCTQQTPVIYTPGSIIQVTNTITCNKPLLSLLWRPLLPSGWTVQSVSGGGYPELVAGEIVWTGTLPASPVQMVYTVQTTLGPDSGQPIAAEMEYQTAGMANALAQRSSITPLLLVPPGPVVFGQLEVDSFAGTNFSGTGSRPMTFKASSNQVSYAVVNGQGVWLTNSIVLKQWDFTVDLAGGVARFALGVVPTNITHISIKAPHCLRKRLPVVFSNGQATVDFTAINQLAGGDVDDSNLVEGDDYFLLASYWHVSVAENPAAAAADFNGDAFCDIFDFVLLSTHWYEHGDPE